MPSLTRSAPLSPFDVESSASVFRRFLLRVAVLGGVASSLLTWNIGPILVCLVFVVGFAMLIAAVSLRQQRRFHALRVGLATARVTVKAVAAVAVVDLAGVPGVLLVALCVALSDPARVAIARHARTAVRRLHGGAPARP